MLTRLTVRNLALLEGLDVPFGQGFAALTGETGAGKSLLLDALGLLLGQRADGSLVRHGEAVAEVVGEFQPSPTAELTALLAEHGLVLEEDGSLLVRRQVKAEGGSKAWVNGVPVPQGVLVQLGSLLAEVQAQHSAPGLLEVARQRDLLDETGGLHGVKVAVGEAFRAWKQAKTNSEDAAAALAAAEAMQEETAARLELLEGLQYEAGEEQRLQAQRVRAQHAAQIAQQLAAADDALNAERGAVSALQVASRQVQAAARLDETLQPLATQLAEALAMTEDAAHGIARASHDEDGLSLEAIDDRLHALKGAARRLGCGVEELAAQQEILQGRATDSAALANTAQRTAAEETAAHHAFTQACAALSAGRAAAAKQLAPQLETTLRALLLPHAVVSIELQPLPEAQWNGQGAEAVQFLLAANPGSPLQPIQKVASGGELARLLLAFKQVLYATLPPQLLVLDEVDTGLSGAAASAVGAALADLGRRHQVLAVTHHAQVAARAAQHGKLAKQVENGRTATQLNWLEGAARTEELARLLAGAAITPAARAAAEALLAEASEGKAAA